MSAAACETTRAMLSPYLEGELSPEYAAAVRAHLDRCAACRAELALLEGVVGALHRLPELPAPAGILAGVRAGLAPRPWYRRPGTRRAGLVFGVPIGAVAAILVVLGVTLFQGRQAGELRRPVAEAPAPPAPALKDEAPAPPTASAPIASRPAESRPAPPRGAARPAPSAPAPRAVEETRPSPGIAPAPTISAPVAGTPATPAAEPQTPPPVPEPRAPAPVARFEAPARFAEEKAVATIQPEAERAAGAARRQPPASAFDTARSGARPREDAGGAPLRTLGATRPERGEPAPQTAARFRAKAPPPAVAEHGEEREPLEVIYVWAGNGEDLADLRGLLGREGGRLLEVRAIDPSTGRQALLPLQEQMIPTSERVRGGWEIDARLPRRNLPRFLDAVQRRRGYQLLQRLPAREETAPPVDQRVKIRVFR